MTQQPRRAAACLTLALLALAAAVTGCERRGTDPQVPSTTPPPAATTTPADPAMPPASAASQ